LTKVIISKEKIIEVVLLLEVVIQELLQIKL